MASGARRAVQGLTGYDGTGPCQPHEAAPVALAPGWLMCGLYTGTGSMNKWLYHSADGGATWEEQRVGGLGLVGLTLLSREHAFLVQQDYPAHRLLETRDGGVTWRFVR